MSMRGQEEKTLKFIEDYKSMVFLWDTNHPHYYKKDKRTEALEKLGKEYDLNVLEVKGKIKCLRSYFMKEYQKTKEDEYYETTWFAYDQMKFISEPSKQNDLESNGNHEPMETSEVVYSNRKPRRVPSNAANSSTAEPVIQSFPTISSVEYAPVSDELGIFGQLVANQIRKFSRRNQAIARNTIQNFLFDMEMREIMQQNELEQIRTVDIQSLDPSSPEQIKRHGESDVYEDYADACKKINTLSSS